MVAELQRNTTDTDLIIQYLRDETPKKQLSPTLAEKLKRINTAADLMQEHRSRLKAYPILCKRFDISRTQAYALIDSALEIYSIRTQQRSRDFYVDLLLEEIRKTKEVAIRRRDPRAAAQADRNLHNAIKEFFGDEEVNIYDQMLPVQVIAIFQPELTGTHLPDDWEAQLEKLKQKKGKKTIDITPVEGADGG